MKNIQTSYKLFEAKRGNSEPKLDPSIQKRLDRGKEQGYVEDWKLDRDKMKIYVSYVNDLAPDAEYDVELQEINNYSQRGKYHITLPYNDKDDPDGEKYIMKPSGKMADGPFNRFVEDILAVAKKFVKANKTKSIKYKGKEYPTEKFMEFLKEDPIVKKIEEDMGLSFKATPKELKNGTFVLFDEDRIAQQKKNWGSNWDDSFAEPSYKITKTGKIYKNPSRQPLTIYNCPPLNSVEDYVKILKKLHEIEFEKNLKKWKDRYDKDQSIVTQMPARYLKYINAKLITAKNWGLLDED
jgi:hypothetical protein